MASWLIFLAGMATGAIAVIGGAAVVALRASDAQGDGDYLPTYSPGGRKIVSHR